MTRGKRRSNSPKREQTEAALSLATAGAKIKLTRVLRCLPSASGSTAGELIGETISLSAAQLRTNAVQVIAKAGSFAKKSKIPGAIRNA